MKPYRIYGIVTVAGAYPGRAYITGRESPGRFWVVMMDGPAAGWSCIVNREQMKAQP